jgi:hypothetical protein
LYRLQEKSMVKRALGGRSPRLGAFRLRRSAVPERPNAASAIAHSIITAISWGRAHKTAGTGNPRSMKKQKHKICFCFFILRDSVSTGLLQKRSNGIAVI